MEQFGAKFLFVLLVLAVYKVKNSVESNDAYCANFQREDIVCFDERTLGACMKIENSWVGIHIAVCNATYNLCCDASVIGCRLNNNCSVVNPTTPSIECSEGERKEHPSNCRFFYVCSGSRWTLTTCAEGYKFNSNFGICTPGDC